MAERLESLEIEARDSEDAERWRREEEGVGDGGTRATVTTGGGLAVWAWRRAARGSAWRGSSQRAVA